MLDINEVSEITEIGKLKIRAEHIQEHIKALNKDISEYSTRADDSIHLLVFTSLTQLNEAYNSITKIVEFFKDIEESVDWGGSEK